LETDSETVNTDDPDVGSGDGPLKAFPEAQGYGAETVGGRGGEVLFVTTLDDGEQQGTLRWALSQEYPRTIVFRVAGNIHLDSDLVVSGPEQGYVTVAGQTAPGDGITITGGRFVLYNTEQVILRYFRVRLGESGEVGGDDAVVGFGVQDMIADHLSVSWGADEAFSVTANDSNAAGNITVQRSLLAEMHPDHPTGSVMGSGGAFHGDRVGNYSIHHNLYAHISHRFPNVGGNGRFEVVNNWVYNWNARLLRTTHAPRLSHIANVYTIGPRLGDRDVTDRLNKHHPDSYGTAAIYTARNIILPDVATDPASNNWGMWQVFTKDTPLDAKYRSDSPHPFDGRHPIAIDTPTEARASIAADVGANARLDETGAWVRRLDHLDAEYIADAENRTGPATYRGPDEWQLPALEPGTPYPDADADGMADPWEAAHGLSTASANDAADRDGDGYTNLEEFLNGTTP
jgi:pectate lyase